MEGELDVIRDVAQKLESAGIAYMLTGSLAMFFYASPRFTRDIDVVIELVAGSAGVFLQKFQSEYYVSTEAVVGSIANRSIFNAIHNDTIIKVDFIVRKDAPYRRVEFERRRQMSLNGFPVWVVSKEDLIISKLDWARDSESDFQLRDVKNVAGGECDLAYIDHWARELDLTELWQRCKP